MRNIFKPIKNIFLADDDEDDILIFKDIIAEILPAIHLSIFSNGKELLDFMGHLVPDLLFLDLDMPRKNGLECLIEIKRNPKLQSLPIVVFSSTTRPSNIQTAYEMGAHLFLIKSSSVTEYRNSLSAILKLNWQFPDQIREQLWINGKYTSFIQV